MVNKAYQSFDGIRGFAALTPSRKQRLA